MGIKDDILKDNVNINENGFKISLNHRDGFVYFIENGYVVQIYVERSGVSDCDILVWGGIQEIKYKYNIKTEVKEIVLKDERIKINNALVLWLNEKEYKHNLKTI